MINAVIFHIHRSRNPHGQLTAVCGQMQNLHVAVGFVTFVTLDGLVYHFTGNDSWRHYHNGFRFFFALINGDLIVLAIIAFKD